ncbi:tautomerase family protein [Paenibacillus polymyxa]|uniref:tautomerase family protein n=1 Tax=Paenibacillus polymyxa TaxID=1406 RepID=UPI0004714611|nr:tautomerase family protein [Paenibacillus polymyxa]
MATVIGISNTDLVGEQLENFIEVIGNAVTTSLELPDHLKSVSLHQLPKEYATKRSYEEITFFVYTAPKPVEAKRALVKNIQAAADEFFSGSSFTTIVIIKEHPDENVGVGGVLRLDKQA